MMRAGTDLIDLAVELHELGPADQRAILGRFEPFEREIIENYLRKVAEPATPSFDALAGLSTWLAESLGAARTTSSNLTPATRDALVDAERLLPRADPLTEAHKPSLLDRLFLKAGRA